MNTVRLLCRTWYVSVVVLAPFCKIDNSFVIECGLVIRVKIMVTPIRTARAAREIDVADALV
jgi:hypothetical protein